MLPIEVVATTEPLALVERRELVRELMAKEVVVAVVRVVAALKVLEPLHVLLLLSSEVPLTRQVPETAKQPVVMLRPFDAVVVAPLMVRTEPLPPMVVLPLLSILKTVVVANAAEDEETLKSCVALPAVPARESLANGEVVPMPTWPVELIKIVEVA